MDYKPVKAKCSCGKPRRPRQRDCRECHAKKMREARKAESEPVERIVRAVKRGKRGQLPPEMEAKLRAKAAELAEQFARFNAGAA